MHRSSHAKRPFSEGLAAAAKRRKLATRPDNEPRGRYITLVENGKDFKIPVSGPKGNWLWGEISDELLRGIIKERIKERGFTTRSQLAKSKPYGARIERKAKERGILDDLLPKQEKGPGTQSPGPKTLDPKPKTGNRKPDTDKPDHMDQEEQWRIRREVIEWMNDDEWWDSLGKK